MEGILDALEGTPWYVYILFLYVIYIGIVSLRPRTVDYRVIFILPTLLTLWSFTLVYSRWDGTSSSFLTWISTLIVGMAIGWQIPLFHKYRADRGRGTISLPGSKWTLALIIALFAVRYTFGYLYATRIVSPNFILTDLALSGFLLGVFIGRAVHYYRIYSKSG